MERLNFMGEKGESRNDGELFRGNRKNYKLKKGRNKGIQNHSTKIQLCWHISVINERNDCLRDI